MKNYLDLARQALAGEPLAWQSRGEEVTTKTTKTIKTPVLLEGLPARLVARLEVSPVGLTDAELAAALPGVPAEQWTERLLDLGERGRVQAVLEPGDEDWRWQLRPPHPRPLEATVKFVIPSVGDVWLVPDGEAAERLGIPAGYWLTPGDLALLEGLQLADRLEVLRWMRATGGRLVAAPAPARSYGCGEAGWRRWLFESLERQATERRQTANKENIQ